VQNLPCSPKLSLSTPQPEAPSWGWGCWDGAPVAGPVPAGRAVPLPLFAPMPLSSARKLALSSFATYTPTRAITCAISTMSMYHIEQTTGDSQLWDLPASCKALSMFSDYRCTGQSGEKGEEKLTLFSDHNGCLLRRQPRGQSGDLKVLWYTLLTQAAGMTLICVHLS